ncbi:MAG: single-stranded DNA-binding protein, partial [Pseudomonadota bacterium]|nr:single-stranded DNA-binding protein [Pseudomonadota bacterium]
TRKWEDQKTGQERYTTEIVANDMQMLGSRGGSGEMPTADTGDFSSKPSVSRSSSPAGNPGSAGDLDLDDDIPF